ncbi:uncharacterized protein LOC120344604 [Styela clava]
MNSDRAKTIYIRDILPRDIKNLLKEPNYDIDKILLQQIKVVSNCKKALVHKRKELLVSIEKEYSENDYKICGPFDGEFLNLVLKDVEKDEAEARRKVLGEQQSVEMFKEAFAADAVSEDYLTSARSYRDAMTRQLRDVVEGREIVLIALEILRRSPMALIPQNNIKMSNLGIAYTEARDRHVDECETLRKLTEYKKNRKLHITDVDELFRFFSDESFEENEDEESDPHEEETEESSLASALAESEAEAQKLVNFKILKVDAIDREFRVLADVTADILKHEVTMKDTLTFINEVASHQLSAASGVGIEKYINYLKMKHPKLKFKLSTKGYNFSLKVMRRTKSVVSLTLLTTLLETSQDLPEEVLHAQERFSQLSNAVKRICSMYGRCAMAFQAILNKEDELQQAIKDTSEVNYADSLRISDNFTFNMKEVRRVNDLKDDIKVIADNILKEVMEIGS